MVPGTVRGMSIPTLKAPAWADEILTLLRGLGDVVSLREALAGKDRDIQRLRAQRDELLKALRKAHESNQELQTTITGRLRYIPPVQN
jgi:hypothetical protein